MKLANRSVNAILLIPCAAGLLTAASCEEKAASPAQESAQPAPEATRPVLTAEENGGEAIKKLGTYTGDLFGMTKLDLGVRAITWRTFDASRTNTLIVRLSFGWWGGEGFMESIAGKNFREQVSYQLTEDDCQQLKGLADRLAHAQFATAPELIQYRIINATYGDVKLRRWPNGTLELFFWNEEKIGDIWLPIKASDFAAFIDEALAISAQLKSQPTTVTW